MSWKQWTSGEVLGIAFMAAAVVAQEAPRTASSSPVVLTLKHSIELALQNSQDIQLAKIQARVADNTANLTKSEFRPNLYVGSGAGYTYGIPSTPGGQAPSVFNVTYSQQLLNEPLRGLEKEQAEQSRAQRVLLDQARGMVMARVASAYLELVKVRHSLELLRKEKDSAEKILQVTQERQGEGFELPVEVTKAQLTRAQVVQRILQLEGRQDELEVFLRSQLGLEAEQTIEVTAEDLPGSAEQEGANLIAMASQSSPSLLLAESDVKGKELRLVGEKRGNWPTVQLVSLYQVLAKFNNYTQFLNNPNNFRYNNLNAGVNIQMPVFSSKTRANIALAEANLDVAKLNLANKRTQVSADVRQKSRKVQQADAAKEVARLELQLATECKRAAIAVRRGQNEFARSGEGAAG